MRAVLRIRQTDALSGDDDRITSYSICRYAAHRRRTRYRNTLLSHKKAQKEHKRRALGFWALSATVAVSLFGLIVVAPLAAASGHSTLARGIYGAFAVLCHQIPERSYFVDGHQFAVCARCTGVYGGFTLMLLLYPLISSLKNTVTPPRSWLILSTVPLVVDVSVNFFGVW